MGKLGIGLKISKCLLMFLNIIFMIVGILLIVAGILILTARQTALMDQMISGFSSSAIGFFVVGGVIFLISFLGCFGACKNSWCLMVVYGIIVLIIDIIVLVLFIFLLVNREGVAVEIKKKMSEDLVNWTPQDKDLRYLGQLQFGFKCCGVNNYTDWLNNKTKWYRDRRFRGNLPKTCCKNVTKEELMKMKKTIALVKAGKIKVTNETFAQIKPVCVIGNSTSAQIQQIVNVQGCHRAVYGQIMKSSVYVLIIFIVVLVVLFLVAVMSFCLAAAFRRRTREEDLRYEKEAGYPLRGGEDD